VQTAKRDCAAKGVWLGESEPAFGVGRLRKKKKTDFAGKSVFF
jgi:hypothetical protein